MSSLTSMFGGGGGGGNMFGGGGGSGGGGGGNTTQGSNYGGGSQSQPMIYGGASPSGRPGETGNAVYPTNSGNDKDKFPLAFGQALIGSEAVFGRKPDYPLAPTPDEILRSNLYANLANQPQAQQFAGNTNQFNQGQLTGLFNQTTPGLFDARRQHLENVQSGLEGELSQSTLNQLQNKGAAWGLSKTGSIASDGNLPASRLMWQLGIETEKRQREAGQELQDLIQSTRRDIMPPLSDPSQFTLRPNYDPYAEDQRLIDIQKVLAAPVPSAAGAAATQQALLEAALAFYSGSPKSGSADPSNYGRNWQTGSGGGGGGGGFQPNYNSGGNSYIGDYYTRGPQ